MLIAAVIPLIAIGIANVGGERYNNRHPRVWLDKQQGYRARATAAQSNSFEAFPFFAAAVIVMLATGLMLRWPSPFSNDLRTGATFVHDWFAFGIWIAVLGHIYFAIRDPVALGGMTRGSVKPYWARKERPAWYREMKQESQGLEEPPPR